MCYKRKSSRHFRSSRLLLCFVDLAHSVSPSNKVYSVDGGR